MISITSDSMISENLHELVKFGRKILINNLSLRLMALRFLPCVVNLTYLKRRKKGGSWSGAAVEEVTLFYLIPVLIPVLANSLNPPQSFGHILVTRD